ncbi:Uncharacterized protein TPAR_01857, partial [Tolypocladium paradoxum]
LIRLVGPRQQPQTRRPWSARGHVGGGYDLYIDEMRTRRGENRAGHQVLRVLQGQFSGKLSDIAAVHLDVDTNRLVRQHRQHHRSTTTAAATMMDAHTALGVAQIVFYVPMVPLAIYLMVRNGKIRPRMAWWPLIPFSLMRLAGGPIIIALEKNPDNLGLIIAAIVLLNVGVIPLIVADLGLTRVVLMDNYSHNPHSNRIGSLLRAAFVIAAALLSAGGALGSQASSDTRSIGHTLTLAGYIIFAVELVTLIGMQLYFWTRRSELLQSSHRVLSGSLVASPFIVVRTIYGILEVVFQNDGATKWNPVYGSAVAFALMALLMEYIALCLYLFTGYSIPAGRGLAAARDAGPAGKV